MPDATQNDDTPTFEAQPPPPWCTVVVVTLDGDPYVMVEGEIDVASAPLVEDDLRRAVEQSTALVRVDLSGVTFLMGSEGTRMLLRLAAFADDLGRQLRFDRPSAAVRHVLDLCRLEWLTDGRSGEKGHRPPDLSGTWSAN